MKKYPELKNWNAGESGKWKLESLSVTGAVFLKAKNYVLRFADQKIEMKFKGVPASSLKNVTFEMFEDTLKNKKLTRVPVRTIRSIGHRLYNMKVDKTALHELDVAR